MKYTNCENLENAICGNCLSKASFIYIEIKANIIFGLTKYENKFYCKKCYILEEIAKKLISK